MTPFTPHCADQAPALRLLPSCWQVLVVDDEPAIHQLTRLALAGAQILGRPLQLLHALSPATACQLLRDNPGVALVLLDMPHEHDPAGLEVVHFVREELGNRALRIVPRIGSGKPGLTVNRLFAAVVEGLKAYRDLRALQRARAGDANISRFGDAFAGVHELAGFASPALRQLGALPFFKAGALIDVSPPEPVGAGAAGAPGEWSLPVEPRFVATLGPWQPRPERDLPATLLDHARVLPHLLVNEGDWYACCLRAERGCRAVLVLRAQYPLASPAYREVEGLARDLARVFRHCTGVLSPQPIPGRETPQAPAPVASEAP